MDDEPIPSGDNGRLQDGRFGPGNAFSKGRPSRPSVWKIAFERATEAGRDIEQEVWLVVDAMLTKAQNGDVAAARIVLDALCVKEPLQVELSGGRELGVIERSARIGQTLAAAQHRLAEQEAEAIEEEEADAE